jgi:CHAT domain-containing protein/tetratricopeptide (TPR) repeat protein
MVERPLPVIISLGSVIAAMVLCAGGCHHTASGSFAAFRRHVDSLRASGAYPEALAAVEAFIVESARGARLRPHEWTDLEALRATVAGIVALPPQARADLAAADRLTPIIESHLTQWEFAAGIAAAARQLEARRRHLGSPHPELAATLCTLGQLLHGQGSYDEAETVLRDALAQSRMTLGNNHPLVARCLTRLGPVLKNTMRREEAGACYDSALAIARASWGNSHLEVAEVLQGMGMLARARRDPEKAIQIQKRALAMRLRLLDRDHLEHVGTLCELGQCLILLGRHEESERYFAWALSIVSGRLGQEHPAAGWPTGGIAVMPRMRGNLAEARVLAERIVRIQERTRSQAHQGFNRQRYGTPAQSSFLAALHLAGGDSLLAWEMHEQGLGMLERELLDWSRPGAGITATEQARIDSLRGALAVSIDELDSLEAGIRVRPAADTARRIDEIRIAIFKAKSALADIHARLTSRPSAPGPAVSIEAVQAVLDDDMAMVGWMLRPAELSPTGVGTPIVWGYVIRKTGPVRWTELRADEGSTSARRHLYQLIERAAGLPARAAVDPQVEAAAQETGTQWVTPLLPSLAGIRHLVVAGRVLFPLEAVTDGRGSPLGDRFLVTYVPSATVFARLRDHEAGGARGFRRALCLADPPFRAEHVEELDAERPLAFLLADAGPHSPHSFPDGTVLREALTGNPDALAKLPRLRRSRREAARVAAVIPEATLLVGRDADEERLRELNRSGALRKCDVLHLATHALVDEVFPERSALVLAQVSPENGVDPRRGEGGGGLLTARDILWSWKLDADLVTLSACKTARGREGGWWWMGDGFVQAFLAAGARSLVLSLWSVDDEATALLMERFYENLTGAYDGQRLGKRGVPMSKAEALHEAKRWLRDFTDGDGGRPFAHPAYWSAFVLIGDPG